MRAVRRGLGWAALVLLSGCAHRGGTPPPAREGPFRIGPEDVVEVSVWRDGDLSRVLPVRPDGYISVPLAGEVRAAGKTPVELAEEISGKLKAYVQAPKVTVMVREVNSARVYVTGEVARPGMYPVRGRVSLLQAVALAGGFSDFADKDDILLIRDGSPYSVRYSDLVSADEEGKRQLWVEAGDTVVVP